MGCSFDRISVTIDTKENMETFINVYNRELLEHFYYGEDNYISEDDFEFVDGVGYTMAIEEEPLFSMMENGAQFTDVVHVYLETVPTCKFSAWYECTFNNCGAIVYITYEYENGVLQIVSRDSEESDISYCPECDWDAFEDDDLEDEALCTIENWEDGKEYKCPSCGAVIEWEVFENKSTLRMVDGNLVEDDKA